MRNRLPSLDDAILFFLCKLFVKDDMSSILVCWLKYFEIKLVYLSSRWDRINMSLDLNMTHGKISHPCIIENSSREDIKQVYFVVAAVNAYWDELSSFEILSSFASNLFKYFFFYCLNVYSVSTYILNNLFYFHIE